MRPFWINVPLTVFHSSLTRELRAFCLTDICRFRWPPFSYFVNFPTYVTVLLYPECRQPGVCLSLPLDSLNSFSISNSISNPSNTVSTNSHLRTFLHLRGLENKSFGLRYMINVKENIRVSVIFCNMLSKKFSWSNVPIQIVLYHNLVVVTLSV